MPHVKSNGINLYYERHGRGEPLLLIQGTLDSMAWGYQLPALSQKYEVIIFDHRGTGRTDAPEAPYSVEEMTNDSLGLIDALGVSRAHLLGYSIGGCIALEMAAKRPESVAKLVIAASYNEISPLGRYRTKVWSEIFKEDKTADRIYKSFLPWFFSDRFFENEANPEAFIHNALNSPYPMTMQGILGLSAAITGYHGIKDMSSIKSPTLVIAGSEDLAAPVKLGKRIADGIKGAQLTVLEGAAHAMIFEDAERFNKTVLDFLER